MVRVISCPPPPTPPINADAPITWLRSWEPAVPGGGCGVEHVAAHASSHLPPNPQCCAHLSISPTTTTTTYCFDEQSGLSSSNDGFQSCNKCDLIGFECLSFFVLKVFQGRSTARRTSHTPRHLAAPGSTTSVDVGCSDSDLSEDKHSCLSIQNNPVSSCWVSHLGITLSSKNTCFLLLLNIILHSKKL